MLVVLVDLLCYSYTAVMMMVMVEIERVVVFKSIELSKDDMRWWKKPGLCGTINEPKKRKKKENTEKPKREYIGEDIQQTSFTVVNLTGFTVEEDGGKCLCLRKLQYITSRCSPLILY